MICVALFGALALLLSGCGTAHSVGQAISGIFNAHGTAKPPTPPPADPIASGLNKWIAIFWSIGLIAVCAGVALVIWTPFKSKGVWTIIFGVCAPLAMTYFAIHFVKIMVCAAVIVGVWYFATHKAARSAVRKELADLSAEAKAEIAKKNL